ncbi:MAG: S1 family peptidase [Xenococcaceae cyanobacterium]
MKLYIPIIACLCIFSVSCGSSETVAQTQNNVRATEAVAKNTDNFDREINPHIKNNIASNITVKITSAENGGSGVIIAKQNNSYLVLTNNHVLRDGKSFTIHTHDGATYQAKPVTNGIETNDDLALLEFSSKKSYQKATINNAATPKVEQTILAVGYDAATEKLVTQEGKIQRIPDKTFKDGYQIGYSSNIVQGMSGGAILNSDGEVIGINGKSAFPIVNTGYVYRDGSKPTSEEIEQYRQLSWGLSLNSFLNQINPKIVTAYDIPLPETEENTENTQLTGWLGELEAKAKQITVRIDSSSGGNGSGIIVAKEGNSYAVLTADHVICEKDKETRKCLDYTYEILAPDGKKYSVDSSTIKRQEGVDLAVVRFTSSENYQVAQLANYPVTTRDAVFVAGYPKLSNDKPSQWRFSLGYGFDRETGLLSVNDNSLSTDSSGLIRSQGSLSGGYEMVYTSITYGGMSGGAVLDRDGRVIGIHGLAEGETALDSQGSSATQI